MSLKPYPVYRDSGVEWLGDVPSHWTVQPATTIARVVTSTVDKKSKEAEVSVRLCNYTDVYYNDIIVDDPAFMRATATHEQMLAFTPRAGDTAITKDSETSDDIGISAHVPADLPGVVFGYHLAIYRPANVRYGRFIKRLFDSKYVKATLETKTLGVTRVGLSQNTMKFLRLPVPPANEASVIADYLDHETAEIDGFIADQEELIRLLHERRAATITQAVTKGLDPNVPMKESGVEWLGRVPKDWGIRQIKWITPVRRGASPRPIDDPIYFDDEGKWSWVRIADVSASDGVLRETRQRLSELGSSLSVKLSPGSIFVSIAATVGKPCITHIPACIHDGFVYFPGLPDYLRDFLFRIFDAGQCYKGLGKLGTQLNLNTDTIGSIKIPMPPTLAMIAEVVKHIDRETAEIDATMADAREAIALSKERRAALISAAVTGKIDVRDHVRAEGAA